MNADRTIPHLQIKTDYEFFLLDELRMEVIDVDAYTGGYNLQIAFSTARLAGQQVAPAGNSTFK